MRGQIHDHHNRANRASLPARCPRRPHRQRLARVPGDGRLVLRQHHVGDRRGRALARARCAEDRHARDELEQEAELADEEHAMARHAIEQLAPLLGAEAREAGTSDERGPPLRHRVCDARVEHGSAVVLAELVVLVRRAHEHVHARSRLLASLDERHDGVAAEVRIDRDRVVAAIRDYQSLVGEAFALARCACGYAINLRSETQVKEYLYDIAKFPVQKSGKRKVAGAKSKGQSSDTDAINALRMSILPFDADHENSEGLSLDYILQRLDGGADMFLEALKIEIEA